MQSKIEFPSKLKSYIRETHSGLADMTINTIIFSGCFFFLSIFMLLFQINDCSVCSSKGNGYCSKVYTLLNKYVSLMCEGNKWFFFPFTAHLPARKTQRNRQYNPFWARFLFCSVPFLFDSFFLNYLINRSKKKHNQTFSYRSISFCLTESKAWAECKQCHTMDMNKYKMLSLILIISMG